MTNSPTPQFRPWLTKFGVPKSQAKRQLDQSPGPLCVPPSVATASGPSLARISPSLAAISSSACSQVIRSHWFSPRAPTRFSG